MRISKKSIKKWSSKIANHVMLLTGTQVKIKQEYLGITVGLRLLTDLYERKITTSTWERLISPRDAGNITRDRERGGAKSRTKVLKELKMLTENGYQLKRNEEQKNPQEEAGNRKPTRQKRLNLGVGGSVKSKRASWAIVEMNEEFHKVKHELAQGMVNQDRACAALTTWGGVIAAVVEASYIPEMEATIRAQEKYPLDRTSE